ncbi:MAG TPA: hypothetical protein VK608_14565 [Edaphobacter sp.]|nr:hypothetical protein [Edaphobacter sp.]
MRVQEVRPDLTSKMAYTVEEAAAMTGWGRDTITRMFENEPGVLIRNHPTKMNKRRYRSIRIPRHVYERVRRRYEVQ